jgi:hypothetical protein
MWGLGWNATACLRSCMLVGVLCMPLHGPGFQEVVAKMPGGGRREVSPPSCGAHANLHCRRVMDGPLHVTAGGMMSADMAREQRRRSWELREEEALTAEEEEESRQRKERRKVRCLSTGCAVHRVPIAVGCARPDAACLLAAGAEAGRACSSQHPPPRAPSLRAFCPVRSHGPAVLACPPARLPACTDAGGGD